jgi:ribosomal protein L11 methyltransferase
VADGGRADRWLVVTVRSPSAERLALAAEGLLASGADAVEELDGGVRTYLRPEHDDAEAALAALRASLEANGAGDAELHAEWRPTEDWLAIWRRGLKPRRIGERLVIAPSWADPVAETGVEWIVVDPQMAFGTGEHASTRGVLRLMQQWDVMGAEALDVGTGSAILAIAAARLGARQAHGVESDADALINAHENVEANGVAGRVTLEEAFVDVKYLEARSGRYDLILANVLSGVLRPLLPAFRSALRPGGGIILAGILQSEADGMVESAAAAGLRLVAEDREEEWWGGLLTAHTG